MLAAWQSEGLEAWGAEGLTGWGFGPVPGFRLYVDGELAMGLEEDVRSFHWPDLGLGDGTYRLELTRIHSCDRESDPAVLELVVGDGGTSVVRVQRPPSFIRARAIAGGLVELRFLSFDTAGVYAAPAAFEVAEREDLGTILQTVAATARTSFGPIEVGPFGHGAQVDLRIRASDGVPGGQRGGWFAAPRVVVDAEGPVAADVVPPESGC